MNVVKNGDLPFGDIIVGEELPATAEFTLVLSAEPAAEDVTTTRKLIVEEANGTNQSVIGILRNSHNIRIGKPAITVAMACFDATSQPLDIAKWPASMDSIGPSQTTPFEFGLPKAGAGLGTDTCPVVLSAGHGQVAP